MIYLLSELETEVFAFTKSSHPPSYNSIFPALQRQCQKCRELFKEILFTETSYTVLADFVSSHQEGLIALLSHLHAFINQNNHPETLHVKHFLKICWPVYNAVKDLLNFLQLHFTRYINQNTALHPLFSKQAREEIKQLILKIEIYFSFTQDQELKSIAISPFQRFLNKNGAATWTLLFYNRALFAEYEKLFNKHNNPSTLQVLHVLFYMNLNPAARHVLQGMSNTR